MEFTVEKVMDRVKLAAAIHSILDSGVEMLGKSRLESADFAKVKIIRSMGPAISSGVLMVQQETAQQRNTLIQERMKQMGYLGTEQKQLG